MTATTTRRHDAATTKRDASERWPEILAAIGGVSADLLDGRHHACPKCGGDDRFRLIDADAGAVFCNQCFAERNGDGFAAVQWLLGCDFPTAVEKVGSYLGNGHAPANGHASRPAKSEPTSYPTARDALATLERQRGKRSGVWTYHDCNGEPVGLVARWDLPDGKKTFLPISRNGSGWIVLGMAEPRPLYRLPELGEAGRVYVCEGEKAADAVRSLDLVATTSVNGSQSPGKSDWSILAGKEVTILPDADKSGEKYARKVGAILAKLKPAPSVKIVELPNLPESGDAVEWIEAGGTRESLIELAELAERAKERQGTRTDMEEADEELPGNCPEVKAGRGQKGKENLPDPIEDQGQARDKAGITNAKLVKDEDGFHAEPIPMTKVVKSILAATDNWPRRVDNALFAHDDAGIHWLDSPASLFGWLAGHVGVVDWRRVQGCVSKEEVFHQLRRVATPYAAVEDFPHFPAIDGHYYTCEPPEPGDGNALSRLLDFFSLETPLDRQLLEAQFATPFWGGPPGTRPALMITAPAGRGKGKTKLAEALGRLYGGHIDISPQEDIAAIKARLLSPDAASKRIALLDNVKKSRFSWAELESLVTIDTISGKRMYVGEATRPNYLCWVITLNGASLSTDMSQRVIEIQIREPDYDPSWEERVNRFIGENKPAILADLVGFFQRPKKTLRRHSRWATWEGNVLSRVEDPDACLDLILERRGLADVEEEEGRIIEDYFAGRLSVLGYDAERADVFIPNCVAARWYNAATGDRAKVAAVSRALRQMVNEGRICQIVAFRSGSTGRGFRWVGEKVDASDVTHYDLERRIARKAEERGQNAEAAKTGEAW